MTALHPNSHLAERARYALFDRQLDAAEALWRAAFQRIGEDYGGRLSRARAHA